MSSDSSLRRRPTVGHGYRTTTPHRHRHSRRSTPNLNRRPRRPFQLLTKSRSEPSLKIHDSGDDSSRWSSASDVGRWRFRLQSCNDVFCSTPTPLRSSEAGYEMDAKVVVTVTFEGSPGPIRTMVRLGSSVDDMIKLVIDKYGEEGRSPRLDASSGSCYDLHLSLFSFECLDRSSVIGDIGSRSFYLRKINCGMSDDDDLEPEAANCRSPSSTLSINEHSLGSGLASMFLPLYITQRMSNFVRKMQELWMILDCFHCQ